MEHLEQKIATSMISDYYKRGFVDKRLLKFFEEITKGLLETERFRGYSKDWKEEMFFESMFHMKRALHERKFKLENNINPFSYFNRIANTSFRQWIEKQKNHVSKCFDYHEYLNGR